MEMVICVHAQNSRYQATLSRGAWPGYESTRRSAKLVISLVMGSCCNTAEFL